MPEIRNARIVIHLEPLPDVNGAIERYVAARKELDAAFADIVCVMAGSLDANARQTA
jgi:hypothetical protein